MWGVGGGIDWVLYISYNSLCEFRNNLKCFVWFCIYGVFFYYDVNFMRVGMVFFFKNLWF